MSHTSDAFSRHELLDRIHVVSSIFQMHVVEHPAVMAEIQSQVDTIADLLEQLYQRVGELNNPDLA